MTVRPYQSKGINDIREAAKKGHKSICYQQAPGSGKTFMFTLITKLAQERNNSVWIIVPRNHLVDQTSDHLKALDVKHNRITANNQESTTFDVHVVSKDTVLRRLKAGRIKNKPAIIIFDECHIALDQQLYIREQMPPETLFIGVSATPERFDGRGLKEMYEILILGISEKELVERDYLVDIRYFAPPVINGLSDLKRVQTEYGIEYNAKQMKAIFNNRAVWGDMIELYRKYGGQEKPALVFCRSVELCDDAEYNFQRAGHKVYSIHGKTPKKTQLEMLKQCRAGEIGLATCDLLTYGIDIPRIELLMFLRFTGSYALYKQMCGRVMRPFEDVQTGYKKTHGVIVDPVGNFRQHGHPLSPREWNFSVDKKAKFEKDPHIDSLKFCRKCTMWYEGDVCPECGATRVIKTPEGFTEVEGRLVEVVPIKYQDRPAQEKREFSDKMSRLSESYRKETAKKAPDQEIITNIIAEYVGLSQDLKKDAMWVYDELNTMKRAVNVPLLSEIRKHAKTAQGEPYKSSWVYFKTKELRKRRGFR